MIDLPEGWTYASEPRREQGMGAFMVTVWKTTIVTPPPANISHTLQSTSREGLDRTIRRIVAGDWPGGVA